ncbi:hypothetical protein [Ottowia thiooxydans]|uniref:hypothetical protein n=1 Tax=Ottowia thiooxydans TaxID=219182 RepID=UPI00048E5A75|nr:hypothetical protein [Ottowia thiooxydans]
MFQFQLGALRLEVGNQNRQCSLPMAERYGRADSNPRGKIQSLSRHRFVASNPFRSGYQRVELWATSHYVKRGLVTAPPQAVHLHKSVRSANLRKG